MNSPFPSVPRYYVYVHLDPETDEIVYVGHGCGARAWLSDTPFRDELHAEYLGMLENTGYTPNEWVSIELKNLTKEEACTKERELIKESKPRYNKIQGAALLKFTPELLLEALNLREQGWSYQKIATHFGFSTMTVHRSLNGGSTALEEILERRK